MWLRFWGKPDTSNQLMVWTLFSGLIGIGFLKLSLLRCQSKCQDLLEASQVNQKAQPMNLGKAADAAGAYVRLRSFKYGIAQISTVGEVLGSTWGRLLPLRCSPRLEVQRCLSGETMALKC